MRPEGRLRQAGMLSLEYMVVAFVFAVVAAVMLERAFYYQEAAEKAAMENTVMNMRTGLRYRMAELMLHGRMEEMSRLAMENPVSWLDAPPANYVGARPAGDVEPGSWYFDSGRRQLCYRVSRSRHFATAGEAKTACYRVVALPGKTRLDGRVEVDGVALELAAPYRWF